VTKKNHPLYGVWNSMIQRCENPRNPKYTSYGARGIRVCGSWREGGNRWNGTPGFDWFLADMGPRPSRRHTLERKDTDGDYEPNNCVWALQKQQQRNRRNNKILALHGRSQSLAAWAEEVKISQFTIQSRLAYGWSVREALTTPVRV
jgi:hypothetical protein